MTPSTSDEVLIDVERYETFPSLTESNACGTNSNSYGAPPPDDMIYIGDVGDPCGCGVTQKMRRVMGEDTISASRLHGFTKSVILLLQCQLRLEYDASGETGWRKCCFVLCTRVHKRFECL